MVHPLLKKVLSLPTAPFHEEAISQFVQNFCKKRGLRCTEDPYGNLKVVYQRGQKGLVQFLAHMDHPGFEVLKGGKTAIVQLLGGVPDSYFREAKVEVWEGNKRILGKVVRCIQPKQRKFFIQSKENIAKGAFGFFYFPEVHEKDGEIYAPACDNLASVSLLLTFLDALVQRKILANVVCFFSRAEEVGFVGSLGLLKTKGVALKKPLIVLESSSAKAGKVGIGEGPVLRVGDRAASFSPGIDLWLKSVAENLSKKNRKFKYQRALLSGGRCEAGLFCMANYLVGCLALPLGNYHNRGDRNYALEYISKKDFENLVLWLLALTKNSFTWKKPLLPSKTAKMLYRLKECRK